MKGKLKPASSTRPFVGGQNHERAIESDRRVGQGFPEE